MKNEVGKVVPSFLKNSLFIGSSRIWRVHAVHLLIFSVPRTTKKGRTCKGARRATSVLQDPTLQKGRNGVQGCTPCPCFEAELLTCFMDCTTCSSSVAPFSFSTSHSNSNHSPHHVLGFIVRSPISIVPVGDKYYKENIKWTKTVQMNGSIHIMPKHEIVEK